MSEVKFSVADSAYILEGSHGQRTCYNVSASLTPCESRRLGRLPHRRGGMAAKPFDRGKSVFEFRKGNLYEGKVEKRSSNYFKRGDGLGRSEERRVGKECRL